MKPTQSIDLATAVALMKGVEKTFINGAKLEQGIHPVNATVTLHVEGSVEKRADVEMMEPVKIDWPAFLASALQKAGVNRTDALAAIQKAAKSYAAEKAVNKDRVADAEREIETLTAELKQSGEVKVRSGATCAQVNVSIINTKQKAA